MLDIVFIIFSPSFLLADKTIAPPWDKCNRFKYTSIHHSVRTPSRLSYRLSGPFLSKGSTSAFL